MRIGIVNLSRVLTSSFNHQPRSKASSTSKLRHTSTDVVRLRTQQSLPLSKISSPRLFVTTITAHDHLLSRRSRQDASHENLYSVLSSTSYISILGYGLPCTILLSFYLVMTVQDWGQSWRRFSDALLYNQGQCSDKIEENTLTIRLINPQMKMRSTGVKPARQVRLERELTTDES